MANGVAGWLEQLGSGLCGGQIHLGGVPLFLGVGWLVLFLLFSHFFQTII